MNRLFPLFFVCTFLFGKGQSIQYGTLGGGIDNWTYNAVTELYYDTLTKKLYAGGLFCLAEGKSVWGAAVWDGTKWDSLQGGFSQFRGQVAPANAQAIQIWKIIGYKGKIYFLGNFDWVNGKSQSRLGIWNGTTWEYPLPYSFSAGNYIKDMTVYNNELYACGMFTAIGTTTCNYIAKFDGINWQSVGNMKKYFGENSPTQMNAIEVFNNEVYVGGYFSDSVHANNRHIAKFDGANWVNVGSGVRQGGACGVYSLKSYNKKLYVGGYFNETNEIPGEGLVAWNGSSYERATAYNLDNYGVVTKFRVYKDRLVVLGNFQHYGLYDAHEILVIDTTQQCSITGIASTFTTSTFWSFESIESMGDTLIVGGQFNSIGAGTVAKNIATIVNYESNANCTLVGLEKNTIDDLQVRIYPNPVQHYLTLELKDSGVKTSLTAYNSLGEVLYYSESIDQTKKIDLSVWNPGIYFFQLRNSFTHRAFKIVKE